MASTFTIWVANAQAELVAGTTITTVDPEAAASVGSDLGVTQFTADDPPCRATSRRRQAVFRAATGGDAQQTYPVGFPRGTRGVPGLEVGKNPHSNTTNIVMRLITKLHQYER